MMRNHQGGAMTDRGRFWSLLVALGVVSHAAHGQEPVVWSYVWKAGDAAPRTLSPPEGWKFCTVQSGPATITDNKLTLQVASAGAASVLASEGDCAVTSSAFQVRWAP